MKANLIGLQRYSKRNSSGIAQKTDFAQKDQDKKQKAIARYLKEGGDYFLEWIPDNYRTHSGEKLSLKEPFYRDYLLILGNPWIETFDIMKAAQMGFSESLNAITAFYPTELRLPAAIGFEEAAKIRKQVSERIQPAFNYSPAVQRIQQEFHKQVKRQDKDNTEGIAVGGVMVNFFHGKPSNASLKDENARQATSSMSSWPSCLINIDEVELWILRMIDVPRKRMDNSLLPVKKMVRGSTPGPEGGVTDLLERSANYRFIWSIQCPHCGEEQHLHPLNNFLKSRKMEVDGKMEEVYFEEIGKPVDWFHKDKYRKEGLAIALLSLTYSKHYQFIPWIIRDYQQDYSLETAYVGCQHCEEPLSQETLDAGHYKCLNTGITVEELCQQALRDQKKIESVSLNLPRLATKRFDPVAQIKELMSDRTKNRADAVQQGLGIPFSIKGRKISLKRLQEASNNVLPFSRDPDFVVMGIDQGKYNHWGMIQHWYLGDEKDKELRFIKAHKKIVWYGKLTFGQIDELVDTWNVDIVGMDSEPDYNLVGNYALKHLPRGNCFYTKEKGLKGQVYLMDQVYLKEVEYNRNERALQGTPERKQETTIPIYSIDRTCWLNAVRDRLYRGLAYLPPGLEYDSSDNSNLFKHYLTSERYTDKNKIIWKEASGEPDHWFHADSFGEAAMSISFYEQGNSSFFFDFV